MSISIERWWSGVLCGLLACDATVPETPTYTEHVRPILEEHCVRCHRAERRDGDVELDRYASARSTRVRSACTSIRPELVEAFGEHLLPGSGDPVPCRDWVVGSMPPGAVEHLDLWQQDVFVRWIVVGAPE